MSMRRPGGTWSCLRTFAALLTILGLVAGCATTKPAPPYLLSPDGIGLAVTSFPKSELATVPSAAGRGFVEGAMAPGAGAAFLGPLVLLIAPFTAVYGAALGASCGQKLDAAYPGLAQKFSEIMQREFFPADVQDQFVAVFQQGTSVPIAREEILDHSDHAPREQQPLAAAAQHGLAHLFLIEISSVSVTPSGKECDSWKVWVGMRIQLWSVADQKRMFFRPVSPYVTGPLSEVKSVFDEPGALRSRLVPTFEVAASEFLEFFHRAMFRLPP